MFTCFGCYCIQLAYVYSVSIGFACCYALDSAVTVKSILVNLNIAAFKADASCASACTSDGFDILQLIFQLYFYLSTIIAYFDIVVAAEVNITAGFYVGCFGCKTVGRQIPTCISSVAYFFQLAYVYSVSIGFACCYIDNLTVSASAAYGYCISSVSYTAGTQSNSAFCTYASTAADSNCIIGCNFILMTEGNNIAYASDCVFVTHYNGIGNIVQSIMGACHEYIMATLFLITGKFVIIADNGRIGLFGNSVGTADYCNSTAFLFSKNRIVTTKNSESIPQ